MPLQYVIYAFDAPGPVEVHLTLKSGKVNQNRGARECLTADEFRGMNPAAIHREMLRALELDQPKADGPPPSDPADPGPSSDWVADHGQFG